MSSTESELIIGIDLGSRTTKIVGYSNGEIVLSDVFSTGHNPLEIIKAELTNRNPRIIAATGYGRHLVASEFNAMRITEICACARGVHEILPEAELIIDVGGQDSKVILKDASGRVLDFEMNDRCAAGTGRFLEFMARTFDMELGEFISLSENAPESVTINSMCTVFAESEVVSLITSGKPRDRIGRGLHESAAKRLAGMVSRFPPVGKMVFVGGGALNDCLHALLQEKTRKEIVRVPDPRIVTAYGAALLAAEKDLLRERN